MGMTRRRAHVLLVEQDEAARDVMVGLLTGAGHRVTTFRDREQALEVLRKQPQPEVILLDLPVISMMTDRNPQILLHTIERMLGQSEIAHDINNPLACVTANLRFVAEQLSISQGTGEPVHNAIAEAQDAASRIHAMVRDVQNPSRSDANPRQAVGVPVTSATRGRVLFIDDEAPLARAVQRFLARDHDVVIVTNGNDALALLERDARFDLILCDLMMPNVTGIELYERLRGARPDLVERIVFMTGGAFTPGARGFLSRVPNPHLEKPFDLDKIRQLVTEAVRR